MNETNVVGMNFQKYNEQKPSFEIRRKIANYATEYLEHGDVQFSKQFFQEILSETNIQVFLFVGYIVHFAFSQDEKGWERLITLIVDELYGNSKLINTEDLLEG